MYTMEEQPAQHLERNGPRDILPTPVWMLAIRIAQAVLSVIVLALAAAVAHDVYLDELGLAIAMSLITVAMVVYMVVTERVVAAQKAYHVVAVLALDAFLVVLWLATFAAVAARRARFVFDVSVSSCSSNGGLVNSKTCMFKRAILFPSGEAMMSAAAGIGALIWILFIVTFIWTLLQFLRGRKQGRFPMGSSNGAGTGQAESRVEQQQAAPMHQSPADTKPQQPAPAHSPSQESSPNESLDQQQAPVFPPPAGTYPSAAGSRHPHGQQPSPQQHP